MGKYDGQIKAIEDELESMQYNKRTQMHYGLLRAKLAKFKETEIRRAGVGKAGGGYAVKKSGSATVILIGFPSTGKSTLLNVLTGADSAVAAYEFTTLDVVPGMMHHRHAKIQILDVPGIVHGAASGRGRGREVLAVMRSADLAVILVDVNKPEQLPAILQEVREAGLRINRRAPDVKIIRKPKGGLSVASTIKLTKLTLETARGILREMGIHNADVVFRTDIDIDDLIDAIEGNKVYLPAIITVSKMDAVGPERLEEVRKGAEADICISAQAGTNISELRDLIFERLGLIRVYCKEAGKKADMDVPLIIRDGATVQTVCEKLHREFVNKFKFARVWGKSAKFDGQKFMLKHRVMDGDILEIHIG